MTAATAARTAAPATLPGRLARAVRSETALARTGIAVLAAHVADDSFLHPPAGTSAADHLVSGLVPLALLALAGWAYPRLRGARRGALALVLGVLAAAAGVEAAHYANQVGASGDDFTGLLALAAAPLLLGVGVVTLWRTRRTDGGVVRRWGRRALLAVLGVVVGMMVVLPVGLAYVTTHTARAVVPANRLGVASEDVTLRTRDGLRLEGWYVPSRNGAAVLAFPGRKGPQRQARMLARHGYGVLLLDRRGEGRSEGAPNAWGWGGWRDIEAAVDWLGRRPDVRDGRIGGIGLSVGGEMLLEAAARLPLLRAVVSEGAGARTFSEERKNEMSGVEKLLGAPLIAVKTAAIAVFSDQRPPTDLERLVPRIAPRPVLLIAAPNSRHGEDLNRRYFAAAGAPKALWEIPESGHTGGIEARPAEYERRVVGFFDRALRR